jgi:hypothetical protein
MELTDFLRSVTGFVDKGLQKAADSADARLTEGGSPRDQTSG